MWNPEHRAAADRPGLRYDSDLTEAEWALVAPLIRPAKRGGRPRMVDVREVLKAIVYVLWTGCQWKALPKEGGGDEGREEGRGGGGVKPVRPRPSSIAKA